MREYGEKKMIRSHNLFHYDRMCKVEDMDYT